MSNATRTSGKLAGISWALSLGLFAVGFAQASGENSPALLWMIASMLVGIFAVGATIAWLLAAAHGITRNPAPENPAPPSSDDKTPRRPRWE
jgi:hypothetical protein